MLLDAFLRSSLVRLLLVLLLAGALFDCEVAAQSGANIAKQAGLDGFYEGKLVFDAISFTSKGKTTSYSTKDFPVLEQSKIRLEVRGSKAKLIVNIPGGVRTLDITLSGTCLPQKDTVTLDKVETSDLGVAVDKFNMNFSGSLKDGDVVAGSGKLQLDAEVPEIEELTGEVTGSAKGAIRGSGKWTVKRLPPEAASGALSLTFVTDGDVPVPVRDLVCTFSINGKPQDKNQRPSAILPCPPLLAEVHHPQVANSAGEFHID